LALKLFNLDNVGRLTSILGERIVLKNLAYSIFLLSAFDKVLLRVLLEHLDAYLIVLSSLLGKVDLCLHSISDLLDARDLFHIFCGFTRLSRDVFEIFNVKTTCLLMHRL